jgi:hypothetical protein
MIQEMNHNTLSRKTPVYADAFSYDIRKNWQNLEIMNLNNNVYDMSYNMSLAVFLRDGREAVEARQRLLFSFLKASGFAATKPTDGINRHYSSLPSDNSYIKRAVKNLCTNYMNPPDREILNSSTLEPIGDEFVNDLINSLFSESSLDYALLKAHQKAKFTGEAAVHPRIRRGAVQLQILTPDQYQVVKDDYGEILEYYKPFHQVIPNPVNATVQSALRFDYWDRDVYRLLDENGIPVPFLHEITHFDSETGTYSVKEQVELLELEHGYGRIPIEILSFDINDGDGTEGREDLYELLKAQLAANMLDYLARENVTYSAIALWVFINFGLGRENLPISPGTALISNNVQQDGSLMPPQTQTVSQETYYESIHSLKEKIMIQAMKNLGLPNSLVLDNPGLASGEAMKVDYRELENIRKEDTALLKPFEKRLLKLIIRIANTDPASPYMGLFSGNYEFSIDYKELFNKETTKEEIEILNEKKRLGIISPLEYLRALKADDTISTDEQAIAEINRNLELFKQTGDNNDKAGTTAKAD